MSNNKQQSSVEWLIAELGEYFPHEIGGIELMVRKAKAMHKLEIFQSYNEGYSAAMNNIPSCKCGLPKFGGHTCSRTDCDQNL